MNYSEFFSIEDYYTRMVMPSNRRFKKEVSGSKVMMVCPFHNDHDPSLGIIKKKSGEEICHCFGCNYWGDIVKVPQDFVKRYQNRYINPEESLVELCNIFDVDRDSLPVENLKDIEDMGSRQESELLKAMDDFDIGDFKYMITDGKRKKKGVGYYNTLLMVMVAKMKENE